MDNRQQQEQPPWERPAFQERRRKNDWVNKMSSILSMVSWIVAMIVWIVLDKAAPEKEHMFTRMFGVELSKTSWDTALLPIAFSLLILALLSSVAAFIFNLLRKRRKTDKYKLSVIIAGLLTALGIALFIARFGLDFTS